jgi:hypothetical protein
LASLYFFICSLSFLSTGFRVAGGRNIGGKEEHSGKQLGLLYLVSVKTNQFSAIIRLRESKVLRYLASICVIALSF